MKNVNLLVVIALLAFACSSSSEKKTTEAVEAPAVVAEEKEVPVVLNPNLASEGELATISQLDEEDVAAIISGRPHLDPITFVEAISAMVGEKATPDVLKYLFLPMNLNTTAESDFLFVPEVGNKMAHEFEEYRPYTSIEQFRREIGKYVDEAQVARYENYVFVPANLNTATKEELMAIPGMGAKMLHEFEEYRPYESIEQFRREIGKYVDENEVTRFERYITL